MSPTTTLILGGGFGGIAAANSLRSLLPEEHQIVVVDQSARFHVGAGKTWLMVGERTYEEISCPRAELLAPGIHQVRAQVLGLNLAEHMATLANETLRWDYLVIALGADLTLAGVPGLAEAAHTFYTIEGVERLRAALAEFSGGDIALLIPKLPIKCPPAPYEAAMLLHHTFASRGLAEKVRLAVYTVEGAPMPTAVAQGAGGNGVSLPTAPSDPAGERTPSAVAVGHSGPVLPLPHPGGNVWYTGRFVH